MCPSPKIINQTSIDMTKHKIFYIIIKDLQVNYKPISKCVNGIKDQDQLDGGSHIKSISTVRGLYKQSRSFKSPISKPH